MSVVEEPGLVRPERIEQILEAIGCLGTWEIDYQADRVRNTGQLPSLYRLTPAQAVDGVHLTLTDRVFHPDDIDDVRRVRRNPVAVNDSRRVLQFRIVDADGQVRWLETHGQIAVDRYGKLVKAQGIAFEVTTSRTIGMSGEHKASLAGLDLLAANLLQAYRGARDLGLVGVEAEVKPILTRVVHLLGRRLRLPSLH